MKWRLCLMLALVVFGAGCGAKQEPTPHPTYTPLSTLTREPTYTPYPTYTLYPSLTPTLTFTPLPTVTSTPVATNTPRPAVVGSKSRPVPFQQSITVKRGNYTLELTLVDVKRGQLAYDIVNAGQEFFRSSPGEGNEFLVARFHVKCLSGPSDYATRLNWLDFAIDANRHLIGTPIVVMNGDLDAALYPGGEDEGWIPFIVPAGAQIGGIRFELDVLAENVIWFAVP